MTAATVSLPELRKRTPIHENWYQLLKDGIKPEQLQTNLHLPMNLGQRHRDVSQLRHTVSPPLHDRLVDPIGNAKVGNLLKIS